MRPRRRQPKASTAPRRNARTAPTGPVMGVRAQSERVTSQERQAQRDSTPETATENQGLLERSRSPWLFGGSTSALGDPTARRQDRKYDRHHEERRRVPDQVPTLRAVGQPLGGHDDGVH